MFVHFERWTLPVLTTWIYAWQDKTVIDAHDKLLKSFSNTSTFRNQYIYIYTGLCRNLPLEPRKNLCPLLYNAVMKHGSWPYILDKSFLQWIILFFCYFFYFYFLFLFLVQAPRVSTYTGNSSFSSRQVLQDECIAFTIPHLSYMYCILTNQNLDFHLKIIKYFCFQLARFKSNLTLAHLFYHQSQGNSDEY